MNTYFAPAKINLSLDVLFKRADGYHEVDMVMQSLELADCLTFKEASEVKLTCNRLDLPIDHQNIIWRAIKLLQEELQISKGIEIHLEKKIPMAAGLAGGSTDAAITLMALNEIWSLGLSQTQLLAFGLKLGADVPFCIMQGTARARGIGEKLQSLPLASELEVLLVTPNVSVATPVVYQGLCLAKIKRRPKTEAVINALSTGETIKIIEHWGNVLEEPALEKFPVINEVKALFEKFGLSSLMSGSGPTVFALAPSREKALLFLESVPSEWFACLTKFAKPKSNLRVAN